MPGQETLVVIFPPLPHLRVRIAVCRRRGSPAWGQVAGGEGGQRCRIGMWDPSSPAGCPSWVCPGLPRHCSSIFSPTTSPCHFPHSLQTQPFITGALYSPGSVSIRITTPPASEWKTRVSSFVGRWPLTSCFIHLSVFLILTEPLCFDFPKLRI